MIDSGGKLPTKLYGSRDDFDFYTVNIPFLSSNIPSGHFMVHTSRSSLDMHDAANIMMILDTATISKLIDFYQKAI